MVKTLTNSSDSTNKEGLSQGVEDTARAIVLAQGWDGNCWKLMKSALENEPK